MLESSWCCTVANRSLARISEEDEQLESHDAGSADARFWLASDMLVHPQGARPPSKSAPASPKLFPAKQASSTVRNLACMRDVMKYL